MILQTCINDNTRNLSETDHVKALPESIVHTEWSLPVVYNAPRHQDVHANLKTFTKYNKRSVQNLYI